MIGFTVRQMHLEDRTDAIEVLGETELLHHLLNHSDSTGTYGLDSVGQLILNRRRSNHRRLTAPVRFVDSVHDSTLASR